MNAAFLVPIDDLVAGLAGDPKLAAQFRHRLASQPTSDKPHSLVYHRTLPPGHRPSPFQGRSVTHVSGTICYLSLRSLNSPYLRRFGRIWRPSRESSREFQASTQRHDEGYHFGRSAEHPRSVANGLRALTGAAR